MSQDIVEVKLLVDGGQAKPTGSVAPTLGPTGVNIGQVIADINKETAAFKGMKVPVTVIVTKKTRTYELEIGIPPASALVMKEAGIQKGSGTPQEMNAGDISYEKVLDVAKTKLPNLLAGSIKTASLEILGTMQSVGVKCDGLHPRELIKKIKAGEMDDRIADWEKKNS